MPRTHTILSMGLLLFPLLAFAGTPGYNVDPKKSPVYFIENKGQVTDLAGNPVDDVLYTVKSGNLSIFIYADGLSYQFDAGEKISGTTFDIMDQDDRRDLNFSPGRNVKTHRVDMRLVNASVHPVVTAENKLAYFENFYNVPSHPEGITHVGAYEKITIENIYPGINWILYNNANSLKYDFEVLPGADPSLIKMQITDASSLQLTDKSNFRITTSLGTITDSKLYCYQKETGSAITSSFRLNKNILSFKTENYDPAKTMIIDPELVWSTYYGGEGEDAGNNIVMDKNDFIYVTGYASSEMGMASAGMQMTYLGGPFDAWIGKFDSLGNRLWCTYYGGSGGDYGTNICTDTAGHIFITGFTFSSDFMTYNAFQNTWSANTDAFLMKFDGDGTRYWATYYGGNSYDYGRGVAVDADQNIIMCGYGRSTNNIAAGGYQNANAGLYDAFVVKFDQTGNRIWGSYFGGEKDDECRGICVDNSRNIYIVGLTESTTGIGNSGYDNTFAGKHDCFIAKFNTSGSLLWSTYYGGGGEDNANAIACDEFNNPYVAVQSSSTSGLGCNVDNIYNGGGFDALLAKFTPSGSLTWATFFGGTADDFGKALYVANNYVYLTGYANSTDNIAFNPFQPDNNGFGDAIIVKYDYDANFFWSTYFGSTMDEYGRGIIAKKTSTIFVTGKTFSPDGIGFNGIQNIFGGGPADMFLLKANECNATTTYYADLDEDGYGEPTLTSNMCFPPPGFVSNSSDCNDDVNGIHPGELEECNGVDDDCNGLTDDADPAVTGTTIWYADSDSDLYGNAAITTIACNAPAGYVSNGNDCADADFNINPGRAELCNTIDDDCDGLTDDNVVLALITAAGPVAFCKGANVVLQASTGAGYMYQWKKNGVNIPGATNANYTATVAADYTVYVSVAGGCNATSPATTVVIYAKPNPVISPIGDLNICATGSVKLKVGKKVGDTYQWYKDGVMISGATNNIYTATSAGTYYVNEVNTSGCSKSSASVIVTSTCKTGEENASDLSIMPNPSNGIFSMQMNAGAMEGNAFISIINETGELVEIESVHFTNGNIEWEMNSGQHLAAGIYYVQVLIGETNYSKKLVIIN